VSITAAIADVADAAIVHALELRSPRFNAEPAWYGLRSQERARPLSDLGCHALAFHLVTTTLKSR
jgi:hypothetical protein